MLDDQDPEDPEQELKVEETADELTGEQLDQVAGGGVEPSPWRSPTRLDPSLPNQVKRPVTGG